MASRLLSSTPHLFPRITTSFSIPSSPHHIKLQPTSQKTSLFAAASSPRASSSAAAATGSNSIELSSSSSEDDPVSNSQPSMDVVVDKGGEDSDSIWNQVMGIVKFAGPATGLWVCAPLMSLIDTAVVGQSSSIELAALGPGTVVCDYLSYVFMFLAIATSNMVANALARKDRDEAQQPISMLLFVALTSGFGMLVFMGVFGEKILSGFIGSKNLSIIPAANSYVQIRGLAWPAVLVGMVAQSASLAMKDSLGPLKVLLVASLVNGTGDVLLCCFLNYGIAGAAWATMVSQFVAAALMVDSLRRTGFRVLEITIPSKTELLQIFELAAPVFVTMISKVAFYSLLTYFATSMGTITLAAHQVMIGIYVMSTVWGEPLSQTAQSFMPEMLSGVNRNLQKARMLLKSLVIIGLVTGVLLGAIGTLVPRFIPFTFTSDANVVNEMHRVLLPYFIALMITPATHSLEGTLLAGRDLRFLSFSMSGCFLFGGLLLFVIGGRGFGLRGCWWTLSAFQWSRFLLALRRLTLPQSMLYTEKNLSKLKAA